MRAIEWTDGEIRILDQSLLPEHEVYRTLRSAEHIAEAIRSMRVRGAPALGIVAGMGVAQAAMQAKSKLPDAVLTRAREAGRLLSATRPTAVNLSWGIERVLARGRAARDGARRDIAGMMVEEALAIQSEDEKACMQMAEHALPFFTSEAVVLTHCNTGWLCTGGYGTALGAIRRAHEEGRGVAVLATETRPLLQGARLTVWELRRLGVPHAIVVDAAAPGLIARGEVSLVVVGADRIASNGDVVNKVGTYPLALAARAADVPFIVVAPTSTVDLNARDGARVPVEERSSAEVTTVRGVEVAPPGTQALNPAFDVTPADLVTAIVTENGVVSPPYAAGLARAVAGRASKAAAGAPGRAAAPARKAPGGAAKRMRAPAGKRTGAPAKAARRPAKAAVKKPAAARGAAPRRGASARSKPKPSPKPTKAPVRKRR